MRHPDTCTHRYRYVGNHISGHPDILAPRNAQTNGHLEIQIFGHLDTKRPSQLDTQTSGHKKRTSIHSDTWTLRHLDIKTLG